MREQNLLNLRQQANGQACVGLAFMTFYLYFNLLNATNAMNNAPKQIK